VDNLFNDELIMKNCKICNKKFVDTTSNKNKVYCSKKCARKNQTIRVSKLKEVNIKRICKGCNKKFIQKFTRKKLYCNQNCYEKTYTEWKKEFYKNKYHTDKEFRERMLKRRRLYNKNNPEKVKKIWINRKKRMQTDPKFRKKRKEYEKKYILLNKKRIAERVKNWRLRTIEKRRIQAREYQLKNKERIKKYLKEWVNRPEVRLKRNQRFKERRKTDPYFRMKLSLRGRLMSFVYRGRAKKMVSTNKLIGCDWNFFKTYIEKQFHDNPQNNKPMTWQNYGKWHIDHIKPMTSFNLLNLKDQYECCNFKNLQPLWAYENRKKSNKLNYYDR